MKPTNLRLLLLIAAIFTASISGVAANFDEAKALYSDRKYKDAYQVAAPLANAGKAEAQAMLGSMFENGHGVKKNVATAAQWYLGAVKQKHVGAMFSLAMIYLDGRSGQVRGKDGKDLLAKAAKAGHVPAMHNLALLYAGAGGTKADWPVAIDWFTKAAARGFGDSQYNLGLLYLEGKGVKKDPVKAAEWFKRAALKGVSEAALDYGVMVFRGEGVQRDEKIGAEWLLFAARNGNVVAQNRVARLYSVGRGVEKNVVEAIKWHLLASQGGRTDEKLDAFAKAATDEQKAAARKRAAALGKLSK